MNAANASHAEMKPQPTQARYTFLIYAAALSLILYLDRICMSESLSSIAKELGFGEEWKGYVFSAFTIGYTLFEVPSGSWGDRYGPKRVLIRIVVWWSLFTVLTGLVWRFSLGFLVNGFAMLLVVRFLFGVGEAGAYPNIAKCSSRWFPLRERGLAQGVVATAGRIGGGVSSGITIAVTLLVNNWIWPGMGWRVTFWLFGLLGLVWAVFFSRWFRNTPAEHPGVNAAELDLIQEGQLAPASSASAHPPDTPWRALLGSHNLWAFSAMAFCSAFVVYLYFTWFPQYLLDRHHIDKARWGWVAGLPMLGGAVGCTLGGILTDWLVRRTGSRRWGRRIMGLVGKGGGAVLLFAGACMDNVVLAVALITLSAFTSDLALAAHWAVSTDAGGRFVGTVFGVMNMVAGGGAALSPVLAGYILGWLSPTAEDGGFDALAREGAWNVVLCIFAGMLVVSALCWLRIDAEESMVGDKDMTQL